MNQQEKLSKKESCKELRWVVCRKTPIQVRKSYVLTYTTLSLIISLQAEHIGSTKYLLYNFYLLYTGTVYICQFRGALITNNQNQTQVSSHCIHLDFDIWMNCIGINLVLIKKSKFSFQFFSLPVFEMQYLLGSELKVTCWKTLKSSLFCFVSTFVRRLEVRTEVRIVNWNVFKKTLTLLYIYWLIVMLALGGAGVSSTIACLWQELQLYNWYFPVGRNIF